MVIPPPPNIAVVSTSLSVESRSRMLCRHAFTWAREKRMKATWIDLRDYRVLPYGMEGSEGLEEIVARLEPATGIIVGFPLYTFNMNSTLKALMEHCGSCFEEKVVGIMAAAGGRSSYMSVMSIAQSLMLDFRAWIVPRHVYAVKGNFADGRIVHSGVCQRVEEMVEIVHRTAWQHGLELPGEYVPDD